MKPDFSKMSKVELKAYVLANRDDIQAIRHLFSRRKSNEERTYYPPLVKDGIPIPENIEIMKEAIQKRLQQTTNSENTKE